MKNILILLPGPLLKRDHKRFGIDILKKNFLVHLLDPTAWLNQSFWKTYSKESYQSKEIVVISSKKDFLDFISKIDTAIVLDYTSYNKKTNWMRKLLKNKNYLSVRFSINQTPQPKKNFLKFLFTAIIEPKKSIFKFYNILQREYYNKKYVPDVFVFSGLVSLNTSKAQNKICAHSSDYDTYLDIKNKQIKKDNPYAVFLDEDMVYHPEYYQLEDYVPPVTEIQYYPILIKFLKKFEIESGLKIKFALSPKSYNKNLPNLLKDIDYSIGNTAELVKNSNAVLLHCSTAISFAILFKKPIFFLTSNKLSKSWIGPKIFSFARVLDSRPINMNNNLNEKLDFQNLFKINEAKYKNYLDQYLKVPNSPEIPLYQIVTEYLKKEKYV